MNLFLNPEFGDKMVTLMAAFVLVLQLAMAAQRWLVTNIRIFGVQSLPASRDHRHHCGLQ